MGNSIDFSEYSELVGEGGYEVKTPTKAEDEFFHAIYISGQQRVNEAGETELPGKLQIRGLKINLEEINMVITHIKNVLVKSFRTPEGKDTLQCFSYQHGDYPWKGTSGNICGKNSTERAANSFCSTCRSQIIISGLYLDEKTKKPFLVNGKAVYLFIRAKGVKYGNVANYLNDLSKKDDLEPIVTPVTDESKKFERSQVNHKRFVTKIGIGKERTKYGMKDVFTLEAGAKLAVKDVKGILDKSKETIEKFKEKFDWSQKGGSSSSYTADKPVEESQKFKEFEGSDSAPPRDEVKKGSDEVSFDDIDF